MKNKFFFRGTLLTTLAFAVLVCGQISTVAQTITKEALLGKIVSTVIVPGYQELEAKCVALTNTLEEFVKAPTAESLEKTRGAWLAAMLASRQIQWLQAGPIADREYLATF
jgi:predicted lipoprotein